jgi:hypothetical protein
MTLSLPLPVALDYPFGVGLVGGPAYVQFGNIEHAIAANKQLGLQRLRVEYMPRGRGDDRKGERTREQRPKSLTDLELKPPPHELLGRAEPEYQPHSLIQCYRFRSVRPMYSRLLPGINIIRGRPISRIYFLPPWPRSTTPPHHPHARPLHAPQTTPRGISRGPKPAARNRPPPNRTNPPPPAILPRIYSGTE